MVVSAKSRYAQPQNRIHTMDGSEPHEILAKVLLVSVNFWDRDGQFSLRVWLLVGESVFNEFLHTQVNKQQKFDCIFLYLLFNFSFYKDIFWVSRERIEG